MSEDDRPPAPTPADAPSFAGGGVSGPAGGRSAGRSFSTSARIPGSGRSRPRVRSAAGLA
jgi:hypothetical protein